MRGLIKKVQPPFLMTSTKGLPRHQVLKNTISRKEINTTVQRYSEATNKKKVKVKSGNMKNRRNRNRSSANDKKH